MSGHQTVRTLPNRENVYLSVLDRPSSTNIESSYESILTPMFEDLRNQTDVSDYPKTVVYTKLDWCGYGHELAKFILGTDIPNDKFPVGQFHAP